MKTIEVLARKYVIRNGQEERELIRARTGKYLVTVNGQVQDARNTLTLAEAQEWYDSAAYQIGDRPE